MEEKLTLAQVAARYGITYQSVNRWIKAGLPYKIERTVGIRPRKVVLLSDVEKFLRVEEEK